MKKIHILLSNSECLVMKGIKLFTGSRYNHVSLSIDGNMDSFHSFGRKVLYFPLIGGFVKEELNKGKYLYLKNVICAIYELDVDEKQYVKLSRILGEFVSHKEQFGYNFWALLGIIVNKPFKHKDKYTCAEFVGTLLTLSGIHTFEKDASMLIPEDFQHIPGIRVLYEGSMADISSEVRSVCCNRG